MSENLHNPGSHGPGDQGHGDYEREDFTTGAVVGSLIGLIVMCVVSFFIVLGMYRYLEKSQMEHVPANPMVTLKESTRAPAKEMGTEAVEVQAFPKPRLQDDDVKDMRQQLYGEESTLQSYGWVDEEGGEARIPIERAMELTAERGLPVRGEVRNEAAAKAESFASVAAKHASPARKKAR